MIARQRFRLAVGALGMGLAVIAVPVAAADPAAPADSAPATDPAPITDAALAPASAPATPTDPSGVITPVNGVQHLPSPDSLPPGTTQEAPEHPTTGLLRDIWHALRDGEMTGPDALKLLAATRPVDQEKLSASKPSNHDGPAAPVADASSVPDPAAPVPVLPTAPAP